jgi:hypothetical protein
MSAIVLRRPSSRKLGLAGGVVLQERHAKSKTLRPLGPSARGVAALHGEDRGALGGIPRGIDRADLAVRRGRRRGRSSAGSF